MKTPELPAPDAKSGLKIDYVAKRLAPALLPLGFNRKARLFTRAAGHGDEAHWQIVQLQADKWNEGPRGAFFVNLAVQFPALMRQAARRPGMDWLERHFDEVDESLGQLRQRLGLLQSALPAGHPCARPAHSDEFRFGSGSDLASLANDVVRATCEVGLPWLQQHASLRALADFEGSLITADVDVRIGAAVLLGDRARAQRILLDRRARFEHVHKTYLANARAWYTDLGLDVSVLPAEPAPAQPSAWELKREAEQRAEEERHARHAEEIRAQAATSRAGPDAAAASATPARCAASTGASGAARDAEPDHATASPSGATLPPAALAEAWVAEHMAQRRSEPAPLTDLPSGRDVATLDAAGREAVLSALLQRLVAAEARPSGPRDPFNPPVDGFDLDESVKALLAVLLPTLPATTEATALAVLRHMKALVTRWRQELVTGDYPWGFALLARWLVGPAGAPHRAALQPAIEAWLQAFSAFAVDAHERRAARVATDAKAAEDPAHPLHEMLREARERAAELAERQPPPSAEEVRRRIAEYPEQCMAGADKQAVAALRRELRRDAASGRLPVAWDGDDWGRSAQTAWQALPAALREALTPTLQRWLEGVDTHPTKTWMRTLHSEMSRLTSAHAAAWRAWVLQQLASFEHCSGRTEWATTGTRPGVDARLGEASENLLQGLLWWAWHDTAIDAAALAQVLQPVCIGAWQRLPDMGARAPTVGSLALRMRASLGDAARAAVAALAQARGAPKQLKQAVERALKEPLVR
jgi:hypothetical protein